MVPLWLEPRTKQVQVNQWTQEKGAKEEFTPTRASHWPWENVLATHIEEDDVGGGIRKRSLP